MREATTIAGISTSVIGNINRNVNVDVDFDRHWGYGGVGVGAAVGTAVAADGVTYQNCGGTYYVPSYDGPNVVDEVVPAPSGWNS